MTRRIFGKNWMTSLLGFILIGFAGYSLYKSNGSITAEAIALATMGAGLVAAKDANTKPPTS